MNLLYLLLVYSLPYYLLLVYKLLLLVQMVLLLLIICLSILSILVLQALKWSLLYKSLRLLLNLIKSYILINKLWLLYKVLRESFIKIIKGWLSCFIKLDCILIFNFTWLFLLNILSAFYILIKFTRKQLINIQILIFCLGCLHIQILVLVFIYFNCLDALINMSHLIIKEQTCCHPKFSFEINNWFILLWIGLINLSFIAYNNLRLLIIYVICHLNIL